VSLHALVICFENVAERHTKSTSSTTRKILVDNYMLPVLLLLLMQRCCRSCCCCCWWCWWFLSLSVSVPFDLGLRCCWTRSTPVKSSRQFSSVIVAFDTYAVWFKLVITGPPTHRVGGHTSNGRWRLSSSSVVVCRL